MDNTKIGMFIKELRIKRGFTQAELAELLQVSHQAVSRWEKGDNLPDVQKLSEMSLLFDVTIDEIVSKGQENPHQISSKNNAQFYFLISVVFSFIGLLIYYILLYATGIFWLPILVQYLTIVGFSLLYIIPYAQLQTKTQEDFKRIKYGVMISIGSMLLPIHTMLWGSFIETIVQWSIVVFLIELVIFWVLSIVERKQFDKPIIMSTTIKRLLLSMLLSLFMIICIGFIGSGLERLWDWDSVYYYIYTGIIYIYTVIIITLVIRDVIKQFNLQIMNVLLLFLFASYQLLYIAFWAEPNDHILPIQQFYAVQDAYSQMFLWFIGLVVINIIIIIVQYFKQNDVFTSSWKQYLLIGLFALFQEFVLVFSRIEFRTRDYSGLSNPSISLYFETGFVFMILIIGLLINEFWTKITIKKADTL